MQLIPTDKSLIKGDLAVTKLPYVVAHRGVSTFYPENTRVAFQAAIDLAVDWIELDVVSTCDDFVIVSHDTTANRCTNGIGFFRDMTLQQVKLLDAGRKFDSHFSNEPIPLLTDVMNLVEKTPIRLNIEIKGQTAEESVSTAQKTLKILQERNLLHRCSISSFDAGCLRAIREWEPKMSVNLDPTPQDGTLSPDELCEQCLQCNANFMSHTYETLTPAIIDAARAHGLALWAWTVNDVDGMQRMLSMGVDAILSDDPGKVQDILRAKA